MTRKEILEQYDVAPQGIITSPGKFEGQMLFVPHFWEVAGEGCPDEELSNYGKPISVCKITAADRKEFPELQPKDKYVVMWETDDGFCRVGNSNSGRAGQPSGRLRIISAARAQRRKPVTSPAILSRQVQDSYGQYRPTGASSC